MGKILSIIILGLLFVKPGFSQNYSYALVNGAQIGQIESRNSLSAVIKDINNRPEIKFVIFTGNLTADGKDSQFENLKDIFSTVLLFLIMLSPEKRI